MDFFFNRLFGCPTENVLEGTRTDTESSSEATAEARREILVVLHEGWRSRAEKEPQ